jgi:spore germination protein GerM
VNGRGAVLPAVLAVLVAAGVLAGGCGIPIEATARTISPAQVPPNVLEPPSTTTPSDSGSCTSDCVTVSVYFTSAGTHVVPVSRPVPATSDSLTTVLGLLFKGPNAGEQGLDIQSALGTRVHLLSPVQVAHGVATVDLNAAFGTLSGNREILAVAQVVYTVSAPNSASLGVEFEIDGAQTEVPLATGALSPVPVHESQYASLLSPASSTTSAP